MNVLWFGSFFVMIFVACLRIYHSNFGYESCHNVVTYFTKYFAAPFIVMMTWCLLFADGISFDSTWFIASNAVKLNAFPTSTPVEIYGYLKKDIDERYATKEYRVEAFYFRNNYSQILIENTVRSYVKDGVEVVQHTDNYFEYYIGGDLCGKAYVEKEYAMTKITFLQAYIHKSNFNSIAPELDLNMLNDDGELNWFINYLIINAVLSFTGVRSMLEACGYAWRDFRNVALTTINFARIVYGDSICWLGLPVIFTMVIPIHGWLLFGFVLAYTTYWASRSFGQPHIQSLLGALLPAVGLYFAASKGSYTSVQEPWFSNIL